MNEEPKERKLIEIRIGVEWVENYKYWRHGVSQVWEYPDGSRRIVESGQQGFDDAEKMAQRWIKRTELLPLPDGPLTGKRIRAKGGPEDEPFVCDGESWKGGENWTVCDLGIPGGTLGALGEYDAASDEYHIKWDDGRKWGDTRPECIWSEAHDWLSEADLLEGAELMKG